MIWPKFMTTDKLSAELAALETRLGKATKQKINDILVSCANCRRILECFFDFRDALANALLFRWWIPNGRID